MEFRLLYFEGCPGWEETKRNLGETLNELGLNTSFESLDVGQGDPPEHFYGSPTVNFRRSSTDEWEDLFGVKGDSVIACRPYEHEGSRTPHIPKAILKSQIVRVSKNGE